MNIVINYPMLAADHPQIEQLRELPHKKLDILSACKSKIISNHTGQDLGTCSEWSIIIQKTEDFMHSNQEPLNFVGCAQRAQNMEGK